MLCSSYFLQSINSTIICTALYYITNNKYIGIMVLFYNKVGKRVKKYKYFKFYQKKILFN